MTSIHIAFFCIPNAAHTNAILSIMAELVRRGYRVTYVTSERFASRALATGVEMVICRRWADSDPEREARFDTHPRIVVCNMNGACRATVRLLNEVLSFYEENRPDLIVYDLVNFTGRILANRWRIPAVQISPQCALDESTLTTQISGADFREWVLEQGRKAETFFERYGVVAHGFVFHREELNIYSIPKAFQPYGPSLDDDRCMYASRCVVERPCDAEWALQSDVRKPIALVATSTTYTRDPEYFRACVDALSESGWHVVISIPDDQDVESLGSLPPNLEIAKGIPQIKILRHASLLIFQGGNISATEAAHFGVPMIAATFGFAELEWSADTNVVRLGLGIHLKKDEFSVRNVREAAARISKDGTIQENVRQLRRIVQSEPGGAEVANRIESHLHRRTM